MAHMFFGDDIVAVFSMKIAKGMKFQKRERISNEISKKKIKKKNEVKDKMVEEVG